MCCGNRRAALSRATPSAAGTRPSAQAMAAAAPERITTIVFEYTGTANSATVTGPASGRVYRFRERGDKLAVDARDRLALMAMAGLRWVR